MSKTTKQRPTRRKDLPVPSVEEALAALRKVYPTLTEAELAAMVESATDQQREWLASVKFRLGKAKPPTVTRETAADVPDDGDQDEPGADDGDAPEDSTPMELQEAGH